MFCSRQTYIFICLLVIILLLYIYPRESFQTMSNKPNQFINYNTSWCFYSRELEPVWEEVMKHYSKNSQVDVLDIKCDLKSNQKLCENAKVKGYPTIIFRNSEKELEYTGPREFKSIVNFIDSNLR